MARGRRRPAKGIHHSDQGYQYTSIAFRQRCREAKFRRRTKTQGSFRDETSALVLLWGLVAFVQIVLRKINGWKDMTQVMKIAWKNAA